MSGHCVVVGYGPGIGAAVARAFAGQGFSVSAIARDGGKLEAACRALQGEGYEAAGFAADAGDETSLTGALDRAQGRFGAVDVLVFNAFRWRPGPVLAMTPGELVGDLQVGVVAALTAARAVAPAMQTRGHGSILLTGGGFALYPSPDAPSLSMAKAAMRSLALMLAQELAPSGVRVGTVTVMGQVAPGTRFDPDAIARAFLALHHGPADPATAETQFA